MMKILVVAATAAEIQPFLSAIACGSELKEQKIIRCSYNNSTVDVLITGVGMVATAYHLGKALTENSYDFALNFGIAGSFNANLQIGSVINIIIDRFADLGAQDGDSFLSVTDLKLLQPDEFPFTGGQLINESKKEYNSIKNLPKVNGITVNTVHGNEGSILKTVNLYHPITESMEGAAFLYACLLEGIPCAQIRAISNYVERRNRDAWNIPLAIKNINEVAVNVLDELGGY